jgi:hypothetical protein
MELAIGLILGYSFGSFSMHRYMKTKIRMVVKMSAKEATDYIESDEAVKELKKQLHIK